MTLLHDKADIVRVLKEAKVIAVVGFNRDAKKPAHYVPEYMNRQGYSVIPVNPSLVGRGESFFGQKAVATLAEIGTPVDVVEVFRRSESVGEHLQDILSMNPLPKVVWMQLGITNDAVAQELRAHGVGVVQNRCMLSDHRTLL
ncbi:CoA-binding protein [Deinococcus sp.]|uniref:CoA-binding protein n=1 Tax=Deinococcus sp. TaxID=47478 RepID=UPI0025C3F31F|nr:CoA-binding protein [Deinococcus sp.]